GHRVVHGGDRYSRPVVVDDAVMSYLESLVRLAPLHQPPSLAGIGEVRRLLPSVPQVACFDTAFHHRLPPAAATYAVPASWRKRWRVRRYGFQDRKSTRLNSSHRTISYAVFCLKKKKIKTT